MTSPLVRVSAADGDVLEVDPWNLRETLVFLRGYWVPYGTDTSYKIVSDTQAARYLQKPRADCRRASTGDRDGRTQMVPLPSDRASDGAPRDRGDGAITPPPPPDGCPVPKLSPADKSPQSEMEQAWNDGFALHFPVDTHNIFWDCPFAPLKVT